MQSSQLTIFSKEPASTSGSTCERITALLADDLDFHSANSNSASHQFHAFPAKFPPQLPQKFISALTERGDLVLDPMMGSGTTLVEALLAKRRPVGFDTDPLAVRIARAKTTSLDAEEVLDTGNAILDAVSLMTKNQRRESREKFHREWDDDTSGFVNYWFDLETQNDLCALMEQIRLIPSASDLGIDSVEELVAFFEVVFSAIIITKSGGVSLALACLVAGFCSVCVKFQAASLA